ncbi:ankyrin repeat-containing domain protein [Jimgerdemannia flammicorona]|uniref:Ankyrin repeat-containing domain protein n=1 Tax=Jimgerdemannia flammicorona TaxID=994334 RepID=A0A433D9H6_9FUNG|nr:ankyrin repeat-containing domain protein [Jimgerdemannia flammicorona]
MDASQSGDLAAVRRVFEQFPGTDVNAPLTAKSLTPLHLAASYDHEHIVRYLVEQRGADVNAVDAEGWTAMHCAAAEGFFDVLTFLVAIPEAELERRTDDGEGIEEVSADEAVREKSRGEDQKARSKENGKRPG